MRDDFKKGRGQCTAGERLVRAAGGENRLTRNMWSVVADRKSSWCCASRLRFPEPDRVLRGQTSGVAELENLGDGKLFLTADVKLGAGGG